MQNTSHAVMAQRIEPRDSPDDFPTPPWATRALFEHVLDDTNELTTLCCLEPACGAGHMARVLKEYFGQVRCSDAYDYGYGDIQDFLTFAHAPTSFDWIITNPPFRLAEQFILRAFPIARKGVAILARTVFLESVGRYDAISTGRRFAWITLAPRGRRGRAGSSLGAGSRPNVGPLHPSSRRCCR